VEHALSLLVRLREGIQVQNIVQSMTTEPRGDKFDVEPSVQFTSNRELYMESSTINFIMPSFPPVYIRSRSDSAHRSGQYFGTVQQFKESGRYIVF
jgi:hypothetical protein